MRLWVGLVTPIDHSPLHLHPDPVTRAGQEMEKGTHCMAGLHHYIIIIMLRIIIIKH